MKKEKTKLVFLFLPLVIVLYMFVSNLIVSLNATEVKFKTTAYDPYDILRGKYLNVAIEYNDNYIIKEILGPVEGDLNSYEGNFIKWYKARTDSDKEKIKTKMNEFCDLYKIHESLNSLTWDFDNDACRPILIDLFKENDKLIDQYGFREILDKMIICEKQGDDYFDIIENTEFTEMKHGQVEDYFDRYNRKKIYVYYDIDENGFAEINKVTFKKEKDNDNYIIESPSIISWNDDWVKTVRINTGSKEFFIDERLASIAENAIFEARSEGKEIVIVCKNTKGNMQIKQMLIDNIDIYEYLENYEQKISN